MTATAAFFRVEGVLTKQGTLALTAYFAANGQGVRDSLGRLARVALTAPMWPVLGGTDRQTATRAAYVSLRGMSEDRIEELASEYWTNTMEGGLLESGLEMIRRARREGHRIVLVSEMIEPVVRHLLSKVPGVDELLCNRLEMRNDFATGRLEGPIVGGHETGRLIRAWAEREGVDLSASMAAGAFGTDVLLLSSVGRPCAVNPDFALRRAAEGAEWPLMVYDA